MVALMHVKKNITLISHRAACAVCLLLFVAAMCSGCVGSRFKPFATVSAVTGEVWKLAPEETEWKAVGEGDALEAGERMRTGEKSAAMIVFRDGGDARLADSSEVLILGPRAGMNEEEKKSPSRGIALYNGEAYIVSKTRWSERKTKPLEAETFSAVAKLGRARLFIREGGSEVSAAQRGSEFYCMAGEIDITEVDGQSILLKQDKAAFFGASGARSGPDGFDVVKMMKYLSAWNDPLDAGGLADEAAKIGAGRCKEKTIEIPAGYVVVKRPEGGKADAVFVDSFCVDVYEYPNESGRMPMETLSAKEAEEKCAESGKRLCSGPEWNRACRGPRKTLYPYGEYYDVSACNVAGTKLQPSGANPLCSNEYGAYDMSGNLWEYTSEDYRHYLANSGLKERRGGSWLTGSAQSSCARPGVYSTWDLGFTGVGFRCCADAPSRK